MVLVTPLQFGIDRRLLSKLDLIIQRIEGKGKKDALLLIEGNEGEGKTNCSIGLSYYISCETKRLFDNSNIYFDVKPLIDLCKEKAGLIALWDEPALQGLKSQWWNDGQIQLTQLLMMARKKRHFFIFNITDFTKFNDYIIKRAVGMLRVYQNQRDGRYYYLYYKKKDLLALYDDWKTKKKRLYNKHKSFRGKLFGYVLPKIINEDAYEKAKDDAIMQIGAKKQTEKDINFKQITTLKYKLINVATQLNMPLNKLSQLIDVPPRTLSDWYKLPEKYPFVLEKHATRRPVGAVITYNDPNKNDLIKPTETNPEIEIKNK